MSGRSEAPRHHDATGPGELGMLIDRDGEVPIGIQLAWALRSRIGKRQFQPGQRLPGLRDLAAEAGVNINTARVVYQRLEQEGLIETRQGSGTFVAPGAREASRVGDIAANAARGAREAGIDPREVAAALYVSSPPAKEPERAPADRRVLLRAQITALETALGELEGTYPGVAPVPVSGSPGEGPRLLDAGELEQVRANLVRRLTHVQAGIDALTGEEPEAEAPPRASRKRPAPKRAPKPATNRAPAPAGA